MNATKRKVGVLVVAVLVVLAMAVPRAVEATNCLICIWGGSCFACVMAPGAGYWNCQVASDCNSCTIWEDCGSARPGADGSDLSGPCNVRAFIQRGVVDNVVYS